MDNLDHEPPASCVAFTTPDEILAFNLFHLHNLASAASMGLAELKPHLRAQLNARWPSLLDIPRGSKSAYATGVATRARDEMFAITAKTPGLAGKLLATLR